MQKKKKEKEKYIFRKVSLVEDEVNRQMWHNSNCEEDVEWSGAQAEEWVFFSVPKEADHFCNLNVKRERIPTANASQGEGSLEGMENPIQRKIQGNEKT